MHFESESFVAFYILRWKSLTPQFHRKNFIENVNLSKKPFFVAWPFGKLFYSSLSVLDIDRGPYN